MNINRTESPFKWTGFRGAGHEIGLAVMPVDQNKVVKNKADIVSVRDEFINRAREMRKKNNGKTLESMGKRLISNR